MRLLGHNFIQVLLAIKSQNDCHILPGNRSLPRKQRLVKIHSLSLHSSFVCTCRKLRRSCRPKKKKAPSATKPSRRVNSPNSFSPSCTLPQTSLLPLVKKTRTQRQHLLLLKVWSLKMKGQLGPSEWPPGRIQDMGRLKSDFRRL